VRSRTLSRIGAAAGILSVVLTFVGYGVHGGGPDSSTADAVRTYVDGASASRSGFGNYLELLGSVVFLVFASFLYSVIRAANPDRLNWLPALGLSAAAAYVGVVTVAAAGQQMLVEWGKAGADAKTVLGGYILVEDTFTLSFELAALFLVAVGSGLFNSGRWLRIIGIGAILIAAFVFASGLIGTVSIESNIPQLGFMLFDVWTIVVAVYLLIWPPLPGLEN
jgi:hypothetical protein